MLKAIAIGGKRGILKSKQRTEFLMDVSPPSGNGVIPSTTTQHNDHAGLLDTAAGRVTAKDDSRHCRSASPIFHAHTFEAGLPAHQ